MSTRTRWSTLLVIGLFAALISTPALAQGTSTSSLAGIVVDSSGGALPGATITVKNNNTGATFTTVSSGTGDFNIPAMPIGTYTVTVALQSFKTVILSDVVLSVGVPTTVRATLEVGAVSETVEVTAAGQMVKTQTTTISSSSAAPFTGCRAGSGSSNSMARPLGCLPAASSSGAIGRRIGAASASRPLTPSHAAK